MKQRIPRSQKTLIAHCDLLHSAGLKHEGFIGINCKEMCKYCNFCEYIKGQAWTMLPKDVYNKYVLKALIEIGEPDETIHSK